MTAALECRAVTVKYGQFTAVDDFSFAFERNRIYAIIGPNGAGKTTLMNAIVGREKLTRGAIVLAGRDVTAMSVPDRARLGFGRSFQITKIFPGMTVLENLGLAAQVTAFRRQPMWRPAASYPALAESARRMLETVGLERFGDVDADKLSHGDQRALELGLTLMPGPEVLLLDEPLAGVGHHALTRAGELLAKAAGGRTMLLIEHNMDAVLRLAQEVLVLVNGRLVAHGPPDEIRRNAQVRSAYLGSEA